MRAIIWIVVTADYGMALQEKLYFSLVPSNSPSPRNITLTSSTREKRIDQLFSQLTSGDTLIVSELSRIGRSVGQIVRTVDALINGKVHFIAVKEDIWLDEERNSQTQAMTRMSGLLADTDRELVSIHTKEGLAAAGRKVVLFWAERETRNVRLVEVAEEESVRLSPPLTSLSWVVNARWDLCSQCHPHWLLSQPIFSPPSCAWRKNCQQLCCRSRQRWPLPHQLRSCHPSKQL